MEPYFLNSSFVSPPPYKHQIKNPVTKFDRPLISRPSENFPPPLKSGGGGGVFYHAPPQPPFLSHSFPPPVPSQYFHHPRQQQPPLLPLPLPVQHNYVNPSSRARGLSCPPVNRKIKNKNPTRDQSLTPRKSSKLPLKPITTVVSPMKPAEVVKEIVDTAINGLGPDPKDPPKVLLSNNDEVIVVNNQADKFSGSVVFTLVSPPPSSLPLPTFSLRPKLSCNTEAAARIDTGATDGLCRLLRLR